LWAAVRLDGGLPDDDTRLGDLDLGLPHTQADPLTLDQLWRMSSGLEFSEALRWGTDQIRTFLHPDARRTALRARLIEAPGRDFHYNDYHTLLLGIVLEKFLESRGLGGQKNEPTLIRAWRERLWEPSGIPENGAWILDSPRSGFPKTESGLVLGSRTLEILGKLILDQGIVGKKPLWDQAWLNAGFDRERAWNRPEHFARYTPSAWGSWLAQGHGWYGRHWWGLERRGELAWFALGIHGQVLLLRPAVQGTAVRLGDRWAMKGWWPEFLFDLLDDPGALD
jgi:CubicO group peptidase (beta-lactamase class C family)